MQKNDLNGIMDSHVDEQFYDKVDKQMIFQLVNENATGLVGQLGASSTLN